MKTTLTNINASLILQALRKAKPVTVNGKAAVENYKQFLVSNSMTAIALENSITSLETTHRDAGLLGLVATLKGLMPESQRKIAVAYEQLQLQRNGLLAGATNEMYAALESLYNYNAAKIIDAINNGELNAFRTNPIIAKLISWANAASKAPESTIANAIRNNEAVTMTIVPMLTLAETDDNKLVSIDDHIFLLGKRGSMQTLPNVDAYDNVSTTVKEVVACMKYLQSVSDQANILTIKPEWRESIYKPLGIQEFTINLLASTDAMFSIDGESMSAEKAIVLLKGSDSIVAQMALNTEATNNALAIIATIIEIVSKYFVGGTMFTFVNKFSNNSTKDAVYLVVTDAVTLVQSVDDNIVSAKSYPTMFDAIRSDIMIANPQISNMAAEVFADQLKQDNDRLSVKQKLIKDMAEEKAEYERLLTSITTELDTLEQTVDANPDKVKALNELKAKAEANVLTLSEQLSNLAK